MIRNPGRDRGRGRGRGRDNPRGRGLRLGNIGREPKEKDKDIHDGLKPIPLIQIERPEEVIGEAAVHIQDLEYVASYSWIDAPKPTIIVPGEPLSA